MSIGDHTNKMRFELAVRPPGYLDGYLPMGWLKEDNRDINWERESLKWSSDHYKTHCHQRKSCIEFITSDKLLAQDPSKMFVCGMHFGLVKTDKT